MDPDNESVEEDDSDDKDKGNLPPKF